MKLTNFQIFLPFIILAILNLNSCKTINKNTISSKSTLRNHNENNYQKGMTFVSDRYCPNVTFGSEKAFYSLKQLQSTGATWVSIVVTEYQKTVHSTQIYPIYQPIYYPYYTHLTATIPDLTKIINEAHSLQLKVMLKPHIDIETSGDRKAPWRGDIDALDSVVDWFESYNKMIGKYANLAEQLGVELFSISCELQSMNSKSNEWRKVIQNVREIYKGQLTIAANPSEEFAKDYWDAVDFIGVDAYYYHAQKGDSVQKIYDIYQKKAEQLYTLHTKFMKPVLITEVGQCSSDLCERTSKCDSIDHQTQANFYEALLRIQQENSNWMKGIYFWAWNSDPAFGGINDPCISPQYKLAEDVMRKYFGGKEKLKKPDYQAECLCTV